MARNDLENRNKGATELEFCRNYIFCGFRLTQYAQNTVPVTWFRFKILLWCSFFNPETEFSSSMKYFETGSSHPVSG